MAEKQKVGNCGIVFESGDMEWVGGGSFRFADQGKGKVNAMLVDARRCLIEGVYIVICRFRLCMERNRFR